MPDSLKENGRPAQQWYWDDWFSAFDVRLCSLEARGLWIDMLGIMWKAEIRGTLTVNGRQVDSKTLAKIAGDTEQNVNKLLNELEENDVFSRLRDGTIICRRVFKKSKRKEEISKIRSKAGKKGAESRWQENGKEDKKNMAKMATSTSSSTSTPSSSSNNIDFAKEFEQLWENYHQDGKKNKKYAKKRFIALCKKGELENFKKGYIGYANFLKAKRVHENFEQTPKYFSTLISDYEEYIGYKYEPKL